MELVTVVHLSVMFKSKSDKSDVGSLAAPEARLVEIMKTNYQQIRDRLTAPYVSCKELHGAMSEMGFLRNGDTIAIVRKALILQNPAMGFAGYVWNNKFFFPLAVSDSNVVSVSVFDLVALKVPSKR